MNDYVPSEENLARVLSGELPDPVFDLSPEQVATVTREKKCPRDGRQLVDSDNPRHPGLNRELSCSCGFAMTT